MKNQAGLYFTERKPVCMSNGFHAITGDFHMGNWMLALRGAHTSLAKVVKKAIGLLPVPLNNHLHPIHPHTKRQADARTTTTSTTTTKPRITLPEELAQVLSTDYLHYLSVHALADLDTLMLVTAMRAATKAEIFADGAQNFSARGEDLPHHTVLLNPLLDSTFWRQMANYADAIYDHQAPFLK
jgi:hypothetical protein